MNITIDGLLGKPEYISAIVERSLANQRDEIILDRYFGFDPTLSRVFKSLYGTTTSVRMGSVIDKSAGKPIRGRRSIGEATLEVIDLGDRFQMDNDRLERLQSLVNSLNRGIVSADVVNNFLVEDFKEVSTAPFKRIEKIAFDLLYNGKASVKLEDNPLGVQVVDMELPILSEKAKAADKDHLIEFLVSIVNKYSYLRFATMEMNQATFLKFFAKSPELLGKYKVTQGGTEVEIKGTVPLSAVNAMLEALDLPTIRVVKNMVTDLNGNDYSLCPDNKIVFLPAGQIGNIRYKSPYELSDRVGGKTYTVLRGDHMIASERTNEGRFIEYECHWVPEIVVPKRIVAIDLTAIK